MRGYFGIGIYHCKTEHNIGTLWRSAYQLGASFIFTIGKRYKKQASDTLQTYRHVPLYHYVHFDEFYQNLPYGCQFVAIEHRGTSLPVYRHAQQAVYLLGAEDYGLPESILEKVQSTIEIPSVRTDCYNVAVAGSIVMYDRMYGRRIG